MCRAPIMGRLNREVIFAITSHLTVAGKAAPQRTFFTLLQMGRGALHGKGKGKPSLLLSIPSWTERGFAFKGKSNANIGIKEESKKALQNSGKIRNSYAFFRKTADLFFTRWELASIPMNYILFSWLQFLMVGSNDWMPLSDQVFRPTGIKYCIGPTGHKTQ